MNEYLQGHAIIHQHASLTGIPYADLVGPCKKRKIAWPRQDVMRAVREETRLSLPQIGQLFGGRDHTTILHGIRASEARKAKSLLTDTGV